MRKLQVGIVGYGSFGSLLGLLTSSYFDVKVFDRTLDDGTGLPEGVQYARSYNELTGCSVIFIATGLDSLPEVCEQLREIVTPETIVADVCSVKVRPAEIMKQILGGKCQLLATHPLFGPQTVTNVNDAKGQKLTWYALSDGDFSPIREFFELHLGIEIVEMTPEDHDKEMAWVHGLTFFTGRALLDMSPPTSTLGTNYYQKLIDLVAVESQHSEELFMTIQRGNPFTDEIRQQFMDTLQKYEDKIKGQSI